MELNQCETVPAVVNEANAVLPAVAQQTLVQPSLQADSSASANDCLAFATISHLSAPLSTQLMLGAPDLTCGMASDGAPPSGQLELALATGTTDKPPLSDKSSWRMHNELLPPARLVEVAHAALQSSGFRRKLAPGAQQPQQLDVQHSQSGLGQAASEVDRVAPAKRDGDGSCDSENVLDVKRPRTTSTDAPFHTVTAELSAPDGALDAVARIINPGLQQQLPPATKREAPPLPPLPNSGISPFSRPQARFSGSGTGNGTAVAPGDAASGTVHGPVKSAFSQAASLPTEWQPGCAVTTGRRSARSPAPKGSRNLSLIRATSAETNSGSVSRRGSGIAPGAPAAGLGEGLGVGSGGGVASVASVSAEHVTENAAVGPNGTAQAGASAAAGALESAASADLRRLAQLAEAAAMLEEQMVTKGCSARPASGGTNVSDTTHAVSAGRGCAAEESSIKAAGATSSRAYADGSGHVMLRHRAASLSTGGLGVAVGAPATTELRQAASLPAHGSGALRSVGSLPGALPEVHPLGRATASGRTGEAGDSGAPESSNGAGDDGVPAGDRRRGNVDSEAASDGGSMDGHHEEDEDDDDIGDDAGDGSNDSMGGGASGSAGGRTLTERYRAALKASAKQRGRGQNTVKLDPEKPPRGSNRNGLCQRIASITKERLQQVYHLNIEEAARELGIGMTKLKEHCRTLGIPRWPSRKLKSMDKLIESLNERAMTEPATKEVIADILAEIESFKRAIYENPCLEVEEDIKRLRQSNFKKEYQQRQVEQRLRGGVPTDKVTGVATAAVSGSGRSSSIGGPQHNQSAAASGAMSAASLAATASGGSGAPLPMAGLQQAVLPSTLASNLGPALFAGQLAAGPAASHNPASTNSAQVVQALAQFQAQPIPAQVPLLAPGQLQLLMAQQPNAFQQLIAQRALGAALQPAPALLLPPMMPQQQLPMGALASVGEAPDAE